jgi:hypothetical protein
MPIALKVAAVAGLVWIVTTVLMLARHLRDRARSNRTLDTSDQ